MSQAAPQRERAAGGDERRSPSPWGLVLLVAIALLVVTGHWTLVVAVLGLALLIFVHELGHYLAAKAFHMRVERFYIGFPPAIVKRTWGETEYGVGVIPLGGFCRISGMMPEEALPDDVLPRAYFSKPVWQRNLTIFAGPLMNFVAAVAIMFVFIQAGGIQQPSLTVAQVVKGSPAAAAGLQPGDRLVAGDGRIFRTWDATTAFFEAHAPRQTVQIVYRTPNGEQRTVAVTLSARPGAAGQGFLGVSPRGTPTYPAPWRAADLAVAKTAGIVAATFQGIWMLVSGKINPTGPEGVAGPAGIISVSQTAVRQSWYPILLAFLSVNLGIINLLPFLPFDGGHIFFNVMESVRGRRVDPRVLERAIAIGVVLLVTLFILLTYNDLHRIFHFG
ncbi:MAG: M50 family metallopeptidase [Thermoleophilia bacterium]